MSRDRRAMNARSLKPLVKMMLGIANIILLGAGARAGETIIIEDFEGVPPGEFPPSWADVTAVRRQCGQPSAVVEEVEGPEGATTRALRIPEAVCPSQGIYRFSSFPERVSLSVDVRIDGDSEPTGPGTANAYPFFA